MSGVLFSKSFAKINLYLEVVKKRPDNYHNIITLFERIDLCDYIYIKERLDSYIDIRSNSKELRFDPSNLIYKTVDTLKKDLKINKGVDIYIKKSIPIASGLGGGSSNAAGVLLGLNRVWKLNLSKERLISYAKRLGADIPFFIYNRPFALGKDKGDRIEVLPIKNKLWHILILPRNIKVFTKDIYTYWDHLNKKSQELTKDKPDVKMLIKGLRENNFSLVQTNIYNQLEDITLKLYPQLVELKKRLEKKGLKNIFMSGSGPAMFGIFSSRKEAQWVKEHLGKIKGVGLILTRTI